MDNTKHWYLVSYDVRDAKRWRRVYKEIKGFGERLQYSVFKLFISNLQMEKLRLMLTQLMAKEDDLLIIRLCPSCAHRIVDTANPDGWDSGRPPFEIL